VPLFLSPLWRLLIPPIRLVSAAIWLTVEQKIVSDYGLLEEFVFMVTEIVPQLLSTRQRAELILGLRARDRRNFFQDVFPGDFGPTYDKLLPTQTLQQIASLLSDASSVLNECMDTFAQPQELKSLLDTQKDLGQLEDIESCIVDSGILSALCLPPVERVVIVNEQTETDVESGLMYTVSQEMEVESESMEGTVNSECVQTQWFGLGSEVKAEMDSVVVTDRLDGTEASESEMAEEPSGTLMIGEDGQVTVLNSVEKKPNRRGRKKKCPEDKDFQVQTKMRGKLDPEFEVLLERPVRKNRGLKMKRYLSQWRKSGKTQGSNATNSSPKRFATKSNDLDERTCKVCGKVVTRAKQKQRNKRLQADEGEQSSSGLPGEAANQELSSDNTGQAEQKSPDVNKSVLEGPFYCPHCSVEFKCKQTFRFHLRNICYNEQQVDPEQPEDVKHCFRCDECDKAFKYKSTLDSHKQTHNPLYCEVCMKLVRDPEALAMHKESHTPFQCNQCVEHFPVFKALHKHYIDVHNPSSLLPAPTCPHCTKRFRSYSDLVEHQKKHTKAYPFLCWECGKKFRHGVTLTRHVERVHHSGEPVTEKPMPIFTCAQCGKTFTSRRCLLKHDNFHHKGLRFHVSTVERDSLARTP
ncbi:hypothetical protein KUCAC02_035013, partial [Chaenocephalus aceratus]